MLLCPPWLAVLLAEPALVLGPVEEEPAAVAADGAVVRVEQRLGP